MYNKEGYQISYSSNLRSSFDYNCNYGQKNNNRLIHQQIKNNSRLKNQQYRTEYVQNLIRQKNFANNIPHNVHVNYQQNQKEVQIKNLIIGSSNPSQINPSNIINHFNQDNQQLRSSCPNTFKKLQISQTNYLSSLNNANNTPAQLPPKKIVYTPSNKIEEKANNFSKLQFLPNKNKEGNHQQNYLKNNTKMSEDSNNQKKHPTTQVFSKYSTINKISYGKTESTDNKTSVISSQQMNGINNVNVNGNQKVFKSLNEIWQKKQHDKKINMEKKNIGSKIIHGFEIGLELGKGKFGEVFMARHHQSGFICAIKKINKKKVKEFKMIDQFITEVKLHYSLDHPNIVKFYGLFEEKLDIYLMLEYMNGGTLFDYLNQVGQVPIKETADYMKDIINAVTYMHDKSIAHRDIKPENIVLSSQGLAKLCDFGWSAIVSTSRKTYCGTFDYAPPEILERKNYDTSVDIWCLGVMIYELLTGHVPFQGQKRNIIMDKIVNVDKNRITYPTSIPQYAKNLIQSLVQKVPSLRPKSAEILTHPFFIINLPKNKNKKFI